MKTKAHLTRDSVCAGDDVDAPHARTAPMDVSPPSPGALFALLDALAPTYLPHVEGRAGWTVWSGIPLGVMADREGPLRPLDLTPADLERLDRRDGALHLHFAYLGRDDPDRAYRRASATLNAARGAGARKSTFFDRLLKRPS